MPGYNRAELTAEVTVVTSEDSEAPREAARRAAVESGLAHEGGPGSTLLSGGRSEVLEAVRRVADAALDAGAHGVEVKVASQADAGRFQST